MPLLFHQCEFFCDAMMLRPETGERKGERARGYTESTCVSGFLPASSQLQLIPI